MTRLHEVTPRAAARELDAVRRRELGGFLRSRRERLRPDQVGLPTTGRRRTPGLRREEVAALAGVGVTWYTWLEQARDVTPSVPVLDAIGRALRLDPHERTHLMVLAGSGVEPPPAAAPIGPGIEAALRQFSPFPAAVLNARFDLLSYNPTYRFLFLDLDTVPAEERNILWLIFTHPDLREALIEREEATARLVGQFRAAMAEHMGEPAWKCLLHRLRAVSPEFVELWDRHEISAAEGMPETVLSPRVGLLRLRQTTLWIDPAQRQRMSLYTPADELTTTRLSTLAALL